MSLSAIQKDDYGYTIELTYIDADTDAAADISAFTVGQTLILEDPDGAQSEKSAAFDTDGSDGVVTYTVADGDIDQAGAWRLRLKLESASSIIRSRWVAFTVRE
jgi:hypothetical protein